MKNTLKTSFKLLMIALFILSCKTSDNIKKLKTCEENIPKCEKWILVMGDSESKFGPFGKSGYINSKGDTTIPLDAYRCLSDTFEYYGLIEEIRGDRKMYGIDKTGKKLFEAVHDGEGFACIEYDGRIIIQKNGKYGFANHKGEIVIEPKYSCAENFREGKARVSNQCRRSKSEYYMWESDNWIYIDKCGNEVSLNNK